MPYVVTALQDGMPVRATRVREGGALVQAMGWSEDGRPNVLIAGGSDRPLDPDAFRRRHQPFVQGAKARPLV